MEFDLPDNPFKFTDLEKLIQQAENELAIDEIPQIFNKAKKAKHILYLPDNAGEIPAAERGRPAASRRLHRLLGPRAALRRCAVVDVYGDLLPVWCLGPGHLALGTAALARETVRLQIFGVRNQPPTAPRNSSGGA